jgi:predicted transcriptional regulator
MKTKKVAFRAVRKPSLKYSGMEIISLPDFETLGRVITGVHQDVKLLAEFGLIEIVESGPRRSASPVAKFSEIVLAA